MYSMRSTLRLPSDQSQGGFETDENVSLAKRETIDHLHYVIDFDLLLARTLTDDQRIQFELFSACSFPWSHVAEYLRMDKSSFFNEQGRIEQMIGFALVEQGIYPSKNYLGLKSSVAVALPGHQEKGFQPVRPPLAPPECNLIVFPKLPTRSITKRAA